MVLQNVVLNGTAQVFKAHRAALKDKKFYRKKIERKSNDFKLFYNSKLAKIIIIKITNLMNYFH